MQAAATLINGLAGEKVRWTEQSKGFKDQMGKLVGDVLLSTAFLSYAGPFNQEYRSKVICAWRNFLKITSLNHKYFRTHLEDSLSLGRPLLVEDVEEELDPVLDNLLERNFIKSGTVLKV
ncbi:hypothetical protein Avbf_11894 [Armadillidium vulgare]|nr:hypothetical protein Avbf_11894 [Armadillidium vulgare]